MTSERELSVLRRRHARLTARLADPGLVLQGTISVVRPRRAAPAPAGRMRVYGPYYQWTWKQAGKTVTVNLSAGQRRAFERAIANQRRLEQTLTALRDVLRQILELTTKGVPKRKR